MRFLLLWVVLIPMISLLKFVATDLMDSVFVKKKPQKRSTSSVYGERNTYKKAQ